NALLGEERQATGAVREGDSKGRHTTTRRELLELPSGALIIDTPGMREIGLWDAADGVAQTFADITEYAGQCRFRDCKHESEPRCAVQAAVAEGKLNDKRLDSYRRLLKEDAYEARKVEPAPSPRTRRRSKSITKAQRLAVEMKKDRD
ncbi:MAG: ribosome biogenesis GTPase, partial [Myxococcota bacterium]